MTSLKYSKKFKQLFAEAENQFTSAINTKLPGKDAQSDMLISPAIEMNTTEHTQEEKAALTAKAMEKVKQSLEVSDELQSILNEIDKINKDVNANKWQLNDKNNTAYLPSKNAQIFKQNNYLCLSYNDKIELFNSVNELHDFLRKHNIPLPQNIKLHEAVEDEEGKEEGEKLGPLAQLLKQYYEKQSAPNTLSTTDRAMRLAKGFNNSKMSREQYVQAMKKDNQAIYNVSGKVIVYDVATGKYKLVNSNQAPKKECGATVGGSIGPAVQYTGSKLNEEEEELQEITAQDRNWKPGMIINKNGEFVRAGEPQGPDERDWSTIPTNRADGFATMWYKLVSDKTNFYPERDPNFQLNGENFLRYKYGDTTKSQRMTTEWKNFWNDKIDREIWEDSSLPLNQRTSNPHYGLLNISNEELKDIAKQFEDAGYGNLLSHMDPNDPDLAQKFHPISIDRPMGFKLPTETPEEAKKKGFLYYSNSNDEVRENWYNAKTNRQKRSSAQDRLIDYLAKMNNASPQEYLSQVLNGHNNRFYGVRDFNQAPEKLPKVNKIKPINFSEPADIEKPMPITAAKPISSDLYSNHPKAKVKIPVSNMYSNHKPAYMNDPTLTKFHDKWVDQLSNPDILADKVLDNIKLMSDMYDDQPVIWNSLIDTLLKDAETNEEIDLSDANLNRLATDLKLKENTPSLGKSFLKLCKQKKDVPLKEDDSPADFATGQSAIASDMSAATDAASGLDTSTTDTTGNMNDYAPDTGMADPNMGVAPAGFGDININTSNGDYSPDMVSQAAAPMPDAPQQKIIDILVDENDPTKIKVKVKDTTTGKVETKNLSEIDA